MFNKRLTAIFIAVAIMLSIVIIPVSASDNLTIASFNASKSTVIVDLDTVSDISPDGIEKKVTLYEYQKGNSLAVDSTVSTTGNSLVITPDGGLEEGKYYRAELGAGIVDSEGNQVEGSLYTNWFKIEVLYSEDFNAKFDADNNMEPIEPYYYDAEVPTILKHSEWLLDISNRNTITMPGADYEFTPSNGLNTVLAWRNGGHAILDKSDLPSDYTVEYIYNFPLAYNFARYDYATQRMRIGDPSTANMHKGIGVRLGGDHSNSSHKSTVELVIDGYSGDLSDYKHDMYTFKGETINVRMSAVGDHFQWFADNEKLFDISGIPTGEGTVAFVDGGWPGQTMSYIDDIVITKYTDMGQALPTISIDNCSTEGNTVIVEFSDNVDEATLDENIVVYQDGELIDNYTVSCVGNGVYIELPDNDGAVYRVDVVKNICSEGDGFVLDGTAQYEFEDIGDTLSQRDFERPAVDNVNVTMLTDSQKILVEYDYTGSYAERTRYEISTSATEDGAYSVVLDGVTEDSAILTGKGDVFKDKYVKVTLYPEDEKGYLGDAYTADAVIGFMSPKVSGLITSGTVEGGALSVEYTFDDENGETNTSTIEWLVADTPDGEYKAIDGENSDTLTIDSTDDLYNKFIKVRVTAKTEEYPYVGNNITSDVLCRVFKPIAKDVKIIGESTIGETLSKSFVFYDYNGKPDSGTTWQWQIADTPGGPWSGVGAVNAENYTVTNDDIGKYLRLCVIPQKEGVPGDETYSGIMVLPTTPQALGVAVSGTAAYGYTVAGKYEYYHPGNVAEGDSLYAWYIDGEKVADTRNYTIKKSDAGKELVFEVTPKAVKKPYGDESIKSPAVTVKKTGSGSGGSGGSGSSGGSHSGGGAAVGGINKVMTDVNTGLKLADENGAGYITPFTDIKESDYIKQIVYLSDLGIINGTSKTTFEPNRPITRAEAAALLCRALKLTSAQMESSYSDVSANEWYAEYVNSVTENGFMCGYEGMFRPNDVITTQEIIKIMVLAYESQFGEIEAYEGTEIPDTASDWAGGYLRKALEKNWYKDAKSIRPIENSVREEAAYLLYNALNVN